MEATTHHNEFPLLSGVFGVITIILRIMDIQTFDQTRLEPLAHTATIMAGCTTVTLFALAIYDRFKTKK